MAKFLYELKDGRKVYGAELSDVQVKALNDYEIEIVGSTGAIDRDGEVIDPKGWQLKNYKKNPVVLPAHDYRQPAIGKAKSVKLKDGKLVFKIEFPPEGVNPVADIYRKLYKLGFMKASSVGFIPIEWVDGDAEKGIRRRYTKQELLELSLVSVPANPEALVSEKGVLEAKEKGIITDEELKLLKEAIVCELNGDCEEKAQKSAESDEINATLEDESIDDIEEKGVVPYKREPLADRGRGWDASASRRRLAIWAGGIDKDKINWGKYRRGFAYVIEGEEENFGGYKLPHHDVIEGGIKTVWRGVVVAMASLLGARGGVNIPEGDKRSVYNHLAKHYRDFDEEPPEFKEFSDDEIVDIFGEEVAKSIGVKVDDDVYRKALFGALDEIKSEGVSKTERDRIKEAIKEALAEVKKEG